MLGKGLESLIPKKDGEGFQEAPQGTDRSLVKPITPSKPPTESIFQIEVDRIKPNPHQPRRHFDEQALRELASSIREFGVIQPLIVSKI